MRTSARVILWLGLVLGGLGCGDEGLPDPLAGLGDANAPSLEASVPANNEQEVPPGRNLFFEFSKAMKPETVTMTISPYHPLGTGSWSHGNRLMTVSLQTTLAAETRYTLVVSGMSEDGGRLSSNAQLVFTTAAVGAGAPAITATTPINGNNQAPVDSALSISFSKPMEMQSVRISVMPGFALGTEVWSDGNRRISFPQPPVPFSSGTRYAVSISGKDFDGIALSGNPTFEFTTQTVVDSSRPTIVSSAPSNGATTVSTNSSLTWIFSKPIDARTAQASFSATPAISCTFSLDAPTSLTCRPASALQVNTSYQVTMNTGAADLTGNTLAAPYVLAFRTTSTVDVTPPTVTTTLPAKAAGGQAPDQSIKLTFSEPMGRSSTEAAFKSSAGSGTFSWNSSSTELTFAPSQRMGFRSNVTWQLSTAATDLSGNPLSSQVTGNFTVRDCIVTGEILTKYNALGGSSSVLGRCTTDPIATADGLARYNRFEGGSIYFSQATGAHEVHGLIHTAWAELGWEKSPLGYPREDENGAPDGVGRFSHFQNGSIYFTPATGAKMVLGAIYAKWASMSWERGPLGYPTTHETATPDGVGRYNHFQNGSIYFTPATGAHEVRGTIYMRWSSMGWERSSLGYPISDEYDVAGGRESRFQNGRIRWAAATNTTQVLPP